MFVRWWRRRQKLRYIRALHMKALTLNELLHELGAADQECHQLAFSRLHEHPAFTDPEQAAATAARLVAILRSAPPERWLQIAHVLHQLAEALLHSGHDGPILAGEAAFLDAILADSGNDGPLRARMVELRTCIRPVPADLAVRLTELAIRDPQIHVRAAAVKCLGPQDPGDSGLDMVLNALATDDPDHFVRWMASLAAVGRRGLLAPQAAREMVEAVLTRQTPDQDLLCRLRELLWELYPPRRAATALCQGGDRMVEETVQRLSLRLAAPSADFFLISSLIYLAFPVDHQKGTPLNALQVTVLRTTLRAARAARRQLSFWPGMHFSQVGLRGTEAELYALCGLTDET